MRFIVRFSCIIALTTLIGPTPGSAGPPGHGFHPPMPDQKLYVRCALTAGDEPTVVEVPLQVPSVMTAAQLDQTVELPAPLKPIRLTRYLPKAALEQNVVPDKSADAKPAIQISIDGPRQSFQRWLVANDEERNRLVSFIGTWRCMAVANKRERNELFEQFENELTRDPRLLISRADGSGSSSLPVKVGVTQAVDGLGCRVRVQRFYLDYALDNKTGQAVNRSEKRLNPAALIEIERDGKKEQRWVFTKMPGFKAQDSERLAYRVILDCPLDKRRPTPDFVLITIGRADQEVWTRHAGESTSRPIAPNEKVKVSGSQYTFRIAKFVPSARLVETYRPSNAKRAGSALQIEITDASGTRVPLWLGLGKQRVVSTEKGPMVVAFGVRQAGAQSQPRPRH